ncbi:hypothetical protein BN903_158 [Halorubrum sp. AJ67]|nr:hypothetical protein BN903_158 [Halorubrum sp. AJ67]
MRDSRFEPILTNKKPVSGVLLVKTTDDTLFLVFSRVSLETLVRFA